MKVYYALAESPDRDSRATREVTALHAAGHDVVLVHPPARRGGRRSPEPVKPGIRAMVPGRHVNGLVPRLLVRIWAWLATVVILLIARPDVVHAYGRRALVRAWLGARSGRALLVYDIAELAVPGGIAARLVKRCDAVIAPSAAVAEQTQARYRLHYLPPIVRDVGTYPASGPPAASLRARLELSDEPVVLQVAGKGQTEGCVAVMHALRTAHGGARLITLCAPQDADVLRLAAEQAMIAGRVEMLRPPSMQRLAAYALEADVAIALCDGDSPTEKAWAETLRYMAAGVPVIVDEAPATAELSAASPNVQAVHAGDGDSLAVALTSALAAKTDHGFDQRWSWGVESRVLVALYAHLRVLRSPGPPLPHRHSPVVLARLAASEARLASQRATHRVPRSLAFYARGRRLRARGDTTAAIVWFEKAIAIDPENATFWHQLGLAKRDGPDAEGAITAFRRVVTLGEAKPTTIVCNSAVALARAGATDDARSVLTALQARARKTPRMLASIGELSVALGDYRTALDAVRSIDTGDEQAIALRPICMRVLERAGEPSAALALAAQIGDKRAQDRLEGTLRALDPTWTPRPPAMRTEAPRSNLVVLHLLETALPYATSGYTYRTSTVLRAQQRGGLRPVAVTRLGFPASRGHRQFSQVADVDGVPCHFLTLPGVRQYTGFPIDELLTHNAEQLARLIEEVRPAVLHATSPHYCGLLGLSLREASGIPLVYEARGFPEMTWASREGGDETEAYRRRRDAETRCMREADAVITLSEVMRDQIVARGTARERVHVVPHMVDTSRFSPIPKDPDMIARYELEGKTVVGYISSLVGYEGVDVLLRAIAALRSRRRDLVGLIVGDGVALPYLRDLARELGIEDMVRFVGRIPHHETAAHYALIDAFVVPRRGLEVCRYVTPLKPFEAMAMQCCLVVADIPALSEVTQWGAHGRVFGADDHVNLADVLDDLIDDPDTRRELGADARRFVLENHSEHLPATVATDPLTAARHAASTQARNRERVLTANTTQ